jgi:hypothetical protein
MRPPGVGGVRRSSAEGVLAGVAAMRVLASLLSQ